MTRSTVRARRAIPPPVVADLAADASLLATLAGQLRTLSAAPDGSNPLGMLGAAGFASAASLLAVELESAEAAR